MINRIFLTIWLSLSLFSHAAASDKIELEITRIKGNDELPRILYIVPWKEVEQVKEEEHKLVLHSLFGNIFDPYYRIEPVYKENN